MNNISNKTSLPSFRQDINGLRAWAVIAVMLYHFGVPGFSGGFVGVDIFFVISGFLMTRIIITGMERGDFSLLDFYLARAKRIIPALLILCLILITLGWLLLPPSEYRTLGVQVASAISFLSNIQFWRQASYFETTSYEKWLLHTWSLSVEWQFYILFPLGVMLIWNNLGKKAVKYILISAGALSFLLSIYLTSHSPVAAFYLLPTRIWEMLAGGMVWWLTRQQTILPKQALLIELLGLILIASSIVFFDATMAWPSGNAVVPVIGTILVLTAKKQHSIFTTNTITNRLGISSYSIYLWHWPIVVLLTNMGEQNNIYFITIGIISSIILGELSYLFIENNTRIRLSALSRKKSIFVMIFSLCTISVITLPIILSSGVNYKWRTAAVTPQANYMNKYFRENYLSKEIKSEYMLDCDFYDSDKNEAKKDSIPADCTRKIKDQDSVFLWGDSHAQALSYGIRYFLKKQVSFYQVASSACLPHIGNDNITEGEFKISCDKSNRYALEKISELKPNIVILAQHSGHEKNNYNLITDELKKLGVSKIIIMGPVPQWWPTLPRAIALRHFDTKKIYIRDNSFDKSILSTNKLMTESALKNRNLIYISVIDSLCQQDTCLAKVDNLNTPLVWDYGHLTLEGSKFIVYNVLLKQTDLSHWFNTQNNDKLHIEINHKFISNIHIQ